VTGLLRFWRFLVLLSVVGAFVFGVELLKTEAGRNAPLPLEEINKRYGNLTPKFWGQDVPGVVTRFDPSGLQVALTLDACGGKGGFGYDKEVVDFLVENNIKATLFLNARWIRDNPDEAKTLAENPLFLIANHGFRHKSCSVNGKTAYGIKGTSSVEEVWEEVEKGARAVEALTGKRPRFYRSGTNYYDEIAVKIVYDLGMKPVGYSILGDGGATFSSERVMEAVIKARPGDIIICHMNHPEGETAEGLKEAVPILLERGYTFIRLDEAIN